MKGTYLQKKRSKESGNTFFTALVFMFVLVGTLRLCCNKTLHEAKLTGIFIQETQGYYLLENLMALARDYAYQITQNPREGNLFLSASSYRKKDKANEASTYVVDFNGSLSKKQIVPDDFPLQIADNGWDIKGGPIFWQDKKKDSNDERWLSEVFMLGTLRFTSGLIPDWTVRMVQTMEIERNPLCDFQLYAEGDTSFAGNITSSDSSWYINFYGPVQVNGNARFPYYMGNVGSKYTYFYKKFNIAGNALRFYSTYKSIKMPEKYHMQDNSTFYDSFTNPYSTGESYHYINKYAINYSSTSTSSISSSGASNTSTYPTSSYQTFEHFSFNTWYGNFSTRSRIYRPCGFDPLSYWGWWEPVTAYQSAPTAGYGVSKELLTLDLCLGMHNLAKSSSLTSHCVYSKKFTNYNPFTHINSLRGLNAYQITEKARLVESQKTINRPSLVYTILLKAKDGISNDLYVPNNVLYTTYNYTSYFPAKYDNFYLNRYLYLKSKNLSIIDSIAISMCKSNDSFSYYFNSNDNPSSSSPNIEGDNVYQYIKNNKLACTSLTGTSFSESEKTTLEQNVFKQTSALTPSAYSDESCPPHKIIEVSDGWKEAPYQTRVKMEESYQFMYDRNRAKWIQIVDFDIGALKNAIGSTISTSDWDAMNHTITVNAYWAGELRNACRNYTYPTYDIRYNYISNRTTFFNTYTNALAYAYPSNNKPVIDIGIRIVNAKELPTGGLTIFCPYPLYLQGDFNTTNTKPKALIITDSLTVLSGKDNNSTKYWVDWKSQMDYYNSYLINPDDVKTRIPPTIYAHIMTGRTHPNYWLTANKSEINPDLGIHDAIRTLEDFRTPIKVYGSILLPFYCQQQWEPPINFCHYGKIRTPKSYAPANWYLGDGSQWKTMRTAPGMPFYHRINRGRKTQAIGETTYDILAGSTLYTKDWDSTSYTFSTYHSALPNYLKYEVAP